MNRRSFIRSVVALPIVASLPVLASKPTAFSVLDSYVEYLLPNGRMLYFYDGGICIETYSRPVIYSSIQDPMSWAASDTIAV